MKRFALTLAAVATFSMFAASPTFASDRYGRGLYDQHNRLHNDLNHRSYHRELTHNDAHRSRMTYRQHGQLHDSLNHDAYHDRVDHNQIHNSYRSNRRSYGTSGFRVSPRGFGYSTGRFGFSFHR